MASMGMTTWWRKSVGLDAPVMCAARSAVPTKERASCGV
jgi:hypothetical protein